MITINHLGLRDRKEGGDNVTRILNSAGCRLSTDITLINAFTTNCSSLCNGACFGKDIWIYYNGRPGLVDQIMHYHSGGRFMTPAGPTGTRSKGLV